MDSTNTARWTPEGLQFAAAGQTVRRLCAPSVVPMEEPMTVRALWSARLVLRIGISGLLIWGPVVSILCVNTRENCCEIHLLILL